jgi:O-antigen ligase
LTLFRYQFQDFSKVFDTAFGEWEVDYYEPVELAQETSGEVFRAFGTFHHPNVTAMHFEFTLPLILALLLIATKPRYRWLFSGLFLIGVAALYVTFSRGAMLGFLAGSTAVILTAFPRKDFPRWMLVGVLALGLLVLLPFMAIKLQSYLTTRPEYYTLRIDHLQSGLRMVQINPLLGTGLNNSTLFLPQFAPGGATWQDRAAPIHTHHLLILIETGIVGFGLYYAFFGSLMIRALGFSRAQEFYSATFAIAISGTFAALAVHLIVDYLNIDALQTLAWFYAGLVVSVARSEGEGDSVSSLSSGMQQ